MTTSNTPDNTVLALDPPKINGQTEPVVGAIVGLSKAAYELVADGEGAVVIVDPPLSGSMDPGDVMKLWIKDDPAVLDSETISDPNAKTVLRIPKGRLHSDRVNEVLYTIERGSNNIGTSPSLTVLYNFIRLGLKDRMTVPGGHSELKLLLPDAIKNGVGPNFVSAVVCVSHPYGRAYDRIDLKCNGELMTAYVGKDQAPQPPDPGSEEPITFCFTVDRAYLERAKRLDQKLNFSYTGTDQIGNGPDPDAPWSPVLTVDEDLDGKRLPMAILLERMEDYPGDDAEEIDLEKLAGGPLHVVVLTIDPRFVPGYEVIATYTAKNTGQPADVVVTVSGKVEADPFGQKKPCILEVPNNKIFADSNVLVTYELRKPNGDLVGNSRPATGTVTGSTPEDLLPPFLVAPAVNPIDVLAYPNGVTVRIEHLQARDGDRARLVEVNPPAGSPQFPLVPFNSNKRVNTVLSPAFLAARHGQTIQLRWNLNRNNAQFGKSPILPLNVLKIADGDPRFPTPNIAGNTSPALDIKNLTADARILAQKWSLFEPGQPIWVWYEGINKNGDPVTKHVRSGEPNDSADGLSVEAQGEWLKELKIESPLKTNFAVNLDSSTDKTKAVTFPQRSYIIKNFDSIYENFKNTPNQQFRPNTPVTLASGLTINVLRNGATPAKIELHQNIVRCLLIPSNSLIEISWKGLATRINLEIIDIQRPNIITFFDPNGNNIETRYLPYPTGHTPKTFEYIAPTGKYISRFNIDATPEAASDAGFLITSFKID